MKNNNKINFFVKMLRFLYSFVEIISFSIGLLIFISIKTISFLIGRVFFLRKLAYFIEKRGIDFCKIIFKLISIGRNKRIDQVEIIELAIKNLSVKKTRTIVTVGGMMVGVGAIVFLVSLGYGVQKLVISRVAKLEEMKQADVFLQNGRKVRITDKTINDFSHVTNVEAASPLISSVGRINYSGSNSDVAVYGVQSDYLKRSAVRPIKGEFFENNETFIDASKIESLKNETVEIKNETEDSFNVRKVEFSIEKDKWLKVRSSADSDSNVLGYTRRTTEFQEGAEIGGGIYQDDKNGNLKKEDGATSFGNWIEASVLIWEKRQCDVAKDFACEDGEYVPVIEEGKQVSKKGYFAEIGIAEIRDFTEKEEIKSSGNNVVEITGNSEFSKSKDRLAVVNQEMLRIMGIGEDDAVGKIFSVVFVLNGEQLDVDEKKIESLPVNYTISGVISGSKTPIIYVPFIDLRTMGVVNYTQAKIISDSEKNLSFVRKQIEAMGYNTSSVVDTVNQIDQFFANVRIALGFFGSIALSVAALGMFNTLTVSLLERTREIGLLKALGMKSGEVREMFLTESMTMGFLGGILGILFGFLAGKIASLALTAFSLFKGAGAIDISFIPTSFIIVIVLISVLTGFLTGLYPARRATKISALNALRYE